MTMYSLISITTSGKDITLLYKTETVILGRRFRGYSITWYITEIDALTGMDPNE
jgi:hypothetical protein